MNQVKLQQYKKELLAQQRRLEKDLAQIPDHEEYGDTIDENAQEVETMESNRVTKVNLNQALKEVKEALSKIGQGTYGLCEQCHQAIPEERLQANPTSKFCLNCQ